jgi:hypothetical protein
MVETIRCVMSPRKVSSLVRNRRILEPLLPVAVVSPMTAAYFPSNIFMEPFTVGERV